MNQHSKKSGLWSVYGLNGDSWETQTDAFEDV